MFTLAEPKSSKSEQIYDSNKPPDTIDCEFVTKNASCFKFYTDQTCYIKQATCMT